MRLIDADKLKPIQVYRGDVFCEMVFMGDIENAPTVDIDAITESHENIGYDKGFRDGYAQATSEVRHGRWLTFGSMHSCSFCGETILVPTTITGIPTYNYCPNCGAKMDEVD